MTTNDPDRMKQWRAEWHARNIERKRVSTAMYARKKNGINVQTILRPMPGVCEVCGSRPPGNRALNCDHDHATGKFRGWLCAECNTMLGYIEKLERDLEYKDCLINFLAVESANNAGVELSAEEFKEMHYKNVPLKGKRHGN